MVRHTGKVMSSSWYKVLAKTKGGEGGVGSEGVSG